MVMQGSPRYEKIPTEIATCPRCKTQFRRKCSKNRREFCNRLCQVAHKRGIAKRDAECDTCGKAFSTTKPLRKYCSKKCGKASNKLCVCENCGGTYRANRSERFCSVRCSRQLTAKGPIIHRGALSAGFMAYVEAWKRWQCEHKSCCWCDKPFVSTTGQKYCSRDCSRLSFNASRVERYRPNLKSGFVMCLMCRGEFECNARANVRKYCVGCAVKIRKGNHKFRVETKGLPYEKIEKYELFWRDNWTCGICGKEVDSTLGGNDPMGPTIDHIIPISKGGGHTWDNVQLAHRTCNESKGNDTEYDGTAQDLCSQIET